MDNINLKKKINRKDLKTKAKKLLKENWKILIPTLIAYFVLLVGTEFLIEKIPFGIIIKIIFITPFFLSMYYKFFIEGIEKNKFTFKSLKINFKIYFSNIKLFLLLIAIFIPIIILLVMGYVFLAASFFMNTTDSSLSLNVTMDSISSYLIILFIISLILFIIYSFILISFSFTYFYLVDKNINDKIGLFKALKNSYSLIKGYRFQYIKFLFSFFGWFLLIIIPFFMFLQCIINYQSIFFSIPALLWGCIGILFLSCYFMICKTLFYKELKDNFETK